MLVFASRTAEGWQDHGAQMKAEIFSERSFNLFYSGCAGMLAFLFIAPAIAQKANLVVQIMSLSVALVCMAAMLGGWVAAFRLPSQKKLTRLVASLQNDEPVTASPPAVGS